MKRICASIGAAILLLGGARAETNAPAAHAPDRIIFLHLRREAGTIRLLDSSIRLGRLKPGPERGALEFEIAGDSGQTLQSGAMHDPAVEHLEYEDPDHPGQLKVREVQRPNAEFMLRVPWREGARSVRFFLKQPPAAGKLSTKAERLPLGEVLLPGGKTE